MNYILTFLLTWGGGPWRIQTVFDSLRVDTMYVIVSYTDTLYPKYINMRKHTIDSILKMYVDTIFPDLPQHLVVKGDTIEFVDNFVTTNKLGIGLGLVSPNTRFQVRDFVDFNTARYWTLLGYNAGNMGVATGGSNTCLGYEAGNSLTTGGDNTFLGLRTGYSTNTGTENVYIGKNAGYNNISGNRNVFIGKEAGRDNIDGSENVFLGMYAGLSNTTGPGNTCLGYRAGFRNTTGSGNVYVGRQAGENDATGYQNVFVGQNAGGNFGGGGYGNTFIGADAGYRNQGQGNTFMGFFAGQNAISGWNNIFIGQGAGKGVTSGGSNVYIGLEAGRDNVAGNENVYIGRDAGRNSTAGSENVCIGYLAGDRNTGVQNTFIGRGAGINNQGYRNVFIGYNAGGFNTTYNNKLYIANGELANEVLISGDFSAKRVGIATTTPGQNLSVAGTLGILEGGVSPSYYTILRGGDQTADITYTLPTSTGLNGQVLTTDGTGVLSWTTAGGGGLPSGASGQTLRHTGTAWVADSFLLNTGTRVGIGMTTAPEYTLDVNGNVRATNYNAGINVEILTGNKTLDPAVDKMYQYLNPDTFNRVITLATATARAGDRFVIRHNGDYANSYFLYINQGVDNLDYIPAGAIKEFIFDGTNWISGGTGTGENNTKRNNVTIGYKASGYKAGVAVGADAIGYNYGVAIGSRSSGENFGVAIGRETIGYTGGVSVGYSSQSYGYGVGVGYAASGLNFGVAVGAYTSAHTEGIAVGAEARGYATGVAVGYDSRGEICGTAVGYRTKGTCYSVALGYEAGYNMADVGVSRYNTLVGAYSGYRLTTGIGNLILGYQSGYDATYAPRAGSKNILLGYKAGTPDTTTSNFLNIGNLIFATGVNADSGIGVSTGNVGIRTTNPTSVLHTAGSFAVAVTTVTSTVTLGVTHNVVLCNGTFTVNLPQSSTCGGRVYHIKNIGTGTITIDPYGTETIDGSLTRTISVQYDCYTIISDGANWWII